MPPAEQQSDGKDNELTADGKAAFLERKEEQQLTQEHATFEQALWQDKWFSRIRIAMGIVAICTIPAVSTICSLIIFDPHQDVVVKRVAESALFFSLIGLIGYVWRVFLNPASVSRLWPVTMTEETSPTFADDKPANRTVTRRLRTPR